MSDALSMGRDPEAPTLDDHDLFPEPDDRNLPPRKCVRHRWVYGWSIKDAPVDQTVCSSCGKVRDEAAVRRGRTNAKRGKAIQRQRIVGLGGQNLPGNKPGHDGIGLAFSYESKSGGFFSERVARVLAAIPRTAAQTAVLIVTETPGPGRRARSYVVVDYDEWKDLHGEQVA